MPKVLRIINRFNLGGITYNVSYLSKYLPGDYETFLMGGPEEKNEESSLYIPQSIGLEPKIIPELRRSLNPLNDYFAYRRIKKIIKEFKPDIVHTHASKAGAIGRLAAIHCNVPVIVHTFHGHVFHGYFNKTVTAVFKRIERYLAGRSSAIVAISKLQKEELCVKHAICNPTKTHVVPLGFDLQKFTQHQDEKRRSFREKYQIAADEIAIGIIGRLAPIKNHGQFINSINHLKNSTNAKIRAFIIGDGDTKTHLEELCEKAGLKWNTTGANGPDIVFTSWIREVDVALAGLDLVCLTSLNEGTPVSLIEAQAASKFIISTNVGGIKDILHPDCGLLSEPGDQSAFDTNLIFAVTHFHELNKKATAASLEILYKFGYQRLCSDMDALYRELLNKKKR